MMANVLMGFAILINAPPVVILVTLTEPNQVAIVLVLAMENHVSGQTLIKEPVKEFVPGNN